MKGFLKITRGNHVERLVRTQVRLKVGEGGTRKKYSIVLKMREDSYTGSGKSNTLPTAYLQ